MKGFKCKKCKRTYKNREEHFSIDKRIKSGFKTECKKCKSEQSKEWLKVQSPGKLLELKERSRLNNIKYRKTEKYKSKRIIYNSNKREKRKFERILKITGKMAVQLNKYTSPSNFDVDEESIFIPECNKWTGSKEREISLITKKY